MPSRSTGPARSGSAGHGRINGSSGAGQHSWRRHPGRQRPGRSGNRLWGSRNGTQPALTAALWVIIANPTRSCAPITKPSRAQLRLTSTGRGVYGGEYQTLSRAARLPFRRMSGTPWQHQRRLCGLGGGRPPATGSLRRRPPLRFVMFRNGGVPSRMRRIQCSGRAVRLAARPTRTRSPRWRTRTMHTPRSCASTKWKKERGLVTVLGALERANTLRISRRARRPPVVPAAVMRCGASFVLVVERLIRHWRRFAALLGHRGAAYGLRFRW